MRDARKRDGGWRVLEKEMVDGGCGIISVRNLKQLIYLHRSIVYIDKRHLKKMSQ
jgi:hypothetical protein